MQPINYTGGLSLPSPDESLALYLKRLKDQQQQGDIPPEVNPNAKQSPIIIPEQIISMFGPWLKPLGRVLSEEGLLTGLTSADVTTQPLNLKPPRLEMEAEVDVPNTLPSSILRRSQALHDFANNPVESGESPMTFQPSDKTSKQKLNELSQRLDLTGSLLNIDPIWTMGSKPFMNSLTLSVFGDPEQGDIENTIGLKKENGILQPLPLPTGITPEEVTQRLQLQEAYVRDLNTINQQKMTHAGALISGTADLLGSLPWYSIGGGIMSKILPSVTATGKALKFLADITHGMVHGAGTMVLSNLPRNIITTVRENKPIEDLGTTMLNEMGMGAGFSIVGRVGDLTSKVFLRGLDIMGIIPSINRPVARALMTSVLPVIVKMSGSYMGGYQQTKIMGSREGMSESEKQQLEMQAQVTGETFAMLHLTDMAGVGGYVLSTARENAAYGLMSKQAKHVAEVLGKIIPENDTNNLIKDIVKEKNKNFLDVNNALGNLGKASQDRLEGQIFELKKEKGIITNRLVNNRIIPSAEEKTNLVNRVAEIDKQVGELHKEWNIREGVSKGVEEVIENPKQPEYEIKRPVTEEEINIVGEKHADIENAKVIGRVVKENTPKIVIPSKPVEKTVLDEALGEFIPPDEGVMSNEEINRAIETYNFMEHPLEVGMGKAATSKGYLTEEQVQTFIDKELKTVSDEKLNELRVRAQLRQEQVPKEDTPIRDRYKKVTDVIEKELNNRKVERLNNNTDQTNKDISTAQSGIKLSSTYDAANVNEVEKNKVLQADGYEEDNDRGSRNSYNTSVSYKVVNQVIGYHKNWNRGNEGDFYANIKNNEQRYLGEGDDPETAVMKSRNDFVSDYKTSLPADMNKGDMDIIESYLGKVYHSWSERIPVKKVILDWFMGGKFVKSMNASPMGTIGTPIYRSSHSDVVDMLKNFFPDAEEIYVDKMNMHGLSSIDEIKGYNPNAVVGYDKDGNIVKQDYRPGKEQWTVFTNPDVNIKDVAKSHTKLDALSVFAAPLEKGILLLPKSDQNDLLAISMPSITNLGKVGSDGKLRFFELPEIWGGHLQYKNGENVNRILNIYKRIFIYSPENELSLPLNIGKEVPMPFNFVKDDGTLEKRPIITVQDFFDAFNTSSNNPMDINYQRAESNAKILSSGVKNTLELKGNDIIKNMIYQTYLALYLNAYRGDTSKDKETFYNNTAELVANNGVLKLYKRLGEAKPTIVKKLDPVAANSAALRLGMTPDGHFPYHPYIKKENGKFYIHAIVGDTEGLGKNYKEYKAAAGEDKKRVDLIDMLYGMFISTNPRDAYKPKTGMDGTMQMVTYKKEGGYESSLGILNKLFNNKERDVLKHSIGAPGMMMKGVISTASPESYLSTHLQEKDIALYIDGATRKINWKGKLDYIDGKTHKDWNLIDPITEDMKIWLPLDIFKELLTKDHVAYRTAGIMNVFTSSDRYPGAVKALDEVSPTWQSDLEGLIRGTIEGNIKDYRDLLRDFKDNPRELINKLIERTDDTETKVMLSKLRKYSNVIKLPEIFLGIANEMKRVLDHDVMSGRSTGVNPVLLPHEHEGVVQSIYRLSVMDYIREHRKELIDKGFTEKDFENEINNAPIRYFLNEDKEHKLNDIEKNALKIKEKVMDGYKLKPGYVVLSREQLNTHNMELSRDVDKNRIFTGILPTTIMDDLRASSIVGVDNRHTNGMIVDPGHMYKSGRDVDGDGETVIIHPYENKGYEIFNKNWKVWREVSNKLDKIYTDEVVGATPAEPRILAEDFRKAFGWKVSEEQLLYKDRWNSRDFNITAKRFLNKDIGKIINMAKTLNDIARTGFNIQIPIVQDGHVVGHSSFEGNKEALKVYNKILYILKVKGTDAAEGPYGIESINTGDALFNLLYNVHITDSGTTLSPEAQKFQRSMTQNIFREMLSRIYDDTLQMQRGRDGTDQDPLTYFDYTNKLANYRKNKDFVQNLSQHKEEFESIIKKVLGVPSPKQGESPESFEKRIPSYLYGIVGVDKDEMGVKSKISPYYIDTLIKTFRFNFNNSLLLHASNKLTAEDNLIFDQSVEHTRQTVHDALKIEQGYLSGINGTYLVKSGMTDALANFSPALSDNIYRYMIGKYSPDKFRDEFVQHTIIPDKLKGQYETSISLADKKSSLLDKIRDYWQGISESKLYGSAKDLKYIPAMPLIKSDIKSIVDKKEVVERKSIIVIPDNKVFYGNKGMPYPPPPGEPYMYEGLRSERFRNTNEPVVVTFNWSKLQYKIINTTNKEGVIVSVKHPYPLVESVVRYNDFMSDPKNKDTWFMGKEGKERMYQLEQIMYKPMTFENKMNDIISYVKDKNGLNGMSINQLPEAKREGAIHRLAVTLADPKLWMFNTDVKNPDLSNIDKYPYNTKGMKIVEAIDPYIFDRYYYSISENLKGITVMPKDDVVTEKTTNEKILDVSNRLLVYGEEMGKKSITNAASQLGFGGFLDYATAMGTLITIGKPLLKTMQAYSKMGISRFRTDLPIRFAAKNVLTKLINMDANESVSYVNSLCDKYENLMSKETGYTVDSLEWVRNILGSQSIRDLQEKAKTSKVDNDNLRNISFALTGFLESYEHMTKVLRGDKVLNALTYKLQGPAIMAKYFSKMVNPHDGKDIFHIDHVLNLDNGQAEEVPYTFEHIMNMYENKPITGKGTITGNAYEAISMYMITSRSFNTYKLFGDHLLKYINDVYKDVEPDMLIHLTASKILDRVKYDGHSISIEGEKPVYLMPWGDRKDMPMYDKLKMLAHGFSETEVSNSLTKVVNKMLKPGEVKGLTDKYDISETDLVKTLKRGILQKLYSEYFTPNVMAQFIQTLTDLSDSFVRNGGEQLGSAGFKMDITDLIRRSNNAMESIKGSRMVPLIFTSEEYKNKFIKENSIGTLNKYKSLVQNMDDTRATKLYGKLTSFNYGYMELKDGKLWGNFPSKIIPDATERRQISSSSLLWRIGNKLINVFDIPVDWSDRESVQTAHNTLDKIIVTPELINQFVESKLDHLTEKISGVNILNANKPGMASIFGEMAILTEDLNLDKMRNGDYGLYKGNDIWERYHANMFNSLNTKLANIVTEHYDYLMKNYNENPIARESALHILRQGAGYNRAFYDKVSMNDTQVGDIIQYVKLDGSWQTGIIYSKNGDIIKMADSLSSEANIKEMSLSSVGNKEVYKASYHDSTKKIMQNLARFAAENSGTNREKLMELLDREEAYIKVPQAVFNIATRFNVGMALGLGHMPAYIWNNIINWERFRQGGWEEFCKYLKQTIHTKETFEHLTTAQKDIAKSAQFTPEMTMFEQFENKLKGDDKTYKEIWNRMTVTDKKEVEKYKANGMLVGKEALPELFGKIGDDMNSFAHWGGFGMSFEKSQRLTTSTAESALTMGTRKGKSGDWNLLEEHIDKALSWITGYSANNILTGDYTLFGRPIATTTDLGRFLYTFMTWKSNKMSVWRMMKEGQDRETLAKMIDPTIKTTVKEDRIKMTVNGEDRYYRAWTPTMNRTKTLLGTTFGNSLMLSLAKKGIAGIILSYLGGQIVPGLDDKVKDIGDWIAKRMEDIPYLETGDIGKYMGDPVFESVMPLVTGSDEILQSLFFGKPLYTKKQVKGDYPHTAYESDLGRSGIDMSRSLAAGMGMGQLYAFFIWHGLSMAADDSGFQKAAEREAFTSLAGPVVSQTARLSVQEKGIGGVSHMTVPDYVPIVGTFLKNPSASILKLTPAKPIQKASKNALDKVNEQYKKQKKREKMVKGKLEASERQKEEMEE